MATITWNGSMDGNLNEGSNWIGGVAPQSSDDVIIANTGTMPNSGFLDSLNSLVINNGVTVGGGCGFNVMGTITINGTLGGYSYINSNSSVTVGATGRISTTAYSMYGTYTVYGQITSGGFSTASGVTVKSGGSISGGDFNNMVGSPGLLVEAGGTVTSMSGFPQVAHNYGTWSAGWSGYGEFRNFNNLSGGTYSAGYFYNEFGGVVHSGTFPSSLSYISNSGTIDGGDWRGHTRAEVGGTITNGLFTGDTITWTGGTSGALGLAANWSPAYVPIASDIISLPASPTRDPSSGTCVVSNVTNNGTIAGGTWNGIIYNAGGTINAGSFTQTSGANTNYSGGIITGTATFAGRVSNTATISGGVFNGQVDNDASASSLISGGAFHGNVYASTGSNITGGTFDTGTVYNGATIGGTNTNPVFNGPVVNNQAGYGMYGVINKGRYTSSVNNTGAVINDGVFTTQLRSTAGGTINGGTWPSEVKYWYSTGSTNWATLSNWWNDAGHTSQATEIPKVTDEVVILGTVVPSIDVATWTQPASISCSGNKIVVANSTAPTRVAISCPITGDCEFQTGIDINSTVVGDCSVYGDSELTVTSTGITGSVMFYNSTRNSSTVTGEATFTGSSTNAGAVVGNAIFAENSVNSGTASGWKASDCVTKDSGFGKHVWESRRAGMKSFIKTGV